MGQHNNDKCQIFHASGRWPCPKRHVRSIQSQRDHTRKGSGEVTRKASVTLAAGHSGFLGFGTSWGIVCKGVFMVSDIEWTGSKGLGVQDLTRIKIFLIAAHPYPLSAFLRTVGPAMWALRSIFCTSTYCSDPKIMLCSGPLLGCFLFRLSGPSPDCFFFFSGVFRLLITTHLTRHDFSWRVLLLLLLSWRSRSCLSVFSSPSASDQIISVAFTCTIPGRHGSIKNRASRKPFIAASWCWWSSLAAWCFHALLIVFFFSLVFPPFFWEDALVWLAPGPQIFWRALLEELKAAVMPVLLPSWQTAPPRLDQSSTHLTKMHYLLPLFPSPACRPLISMSNCASTSNFAWIVRPWSSL